jgi:hypothetical protein
MPFKIPGTGDAGVAAREEDSRPIQRRAAERATVILL